MTPPTPAAVRAAMTPFYLRTHADGEVLANEPRDNTEILRDHIRAIAAEMRAYRSYPDECPTMALEKFADKLEGKQ